MRTLWRASLGIEGCVDDGQVVGFRGVEVMVVSLFGIEGGLDDAGCDCVAVM